MVKKIFYVLTVATLIGSQTVFAFQPKETAKYFNGPVVTAISSTSATVSLTDAALTDVTSEEKTGIYFEYKETYQMCIMVYPTPEYCLPKKTEVGKTTATLTNLKPNTSYTVTYKRDTTIRCITTPCPENSFESLSVEFKTKSSDDSVADPSTGATSTSPVPSRPSVGGWLFNKHLSLGSRGADVTALQNILIKHGYLNAAATGYFGPRTFKAVKDFQLAHKISSLGFVGPRTRHILNNQNDSTTVASDEVMFEGIVTAYSTSCFADGICSITVDDKKIVTTRGWSHDIVGQVTGIPDFGSIESNVGAHAKVYAKKTDDGYTLYGKKDYYITIMPAASRKLPAGSVPVGDIGAIKGTSWLWQKTVMSDGSVVTPKVADKFTVTISTDGNISGTTDCNSFSGTYMLGSDGVLSFGPFMSTLMYCDGSQEQVFVSAVQKTSSYSIDASSGTLVLNLTNNAGKVYFVKK